MTIVNSDTFNGCIALISVNLSNTCKTINANSFNGCVSLTNVGDLSGLTSLGGSNHFNGCIKLTGVNFSNKLTTIPGGIFNGCTSLTAIGDLSSVTSIGSNSFNSTKITSVALTACTSIYYYAFYNCSKLTQVGITNLCTFIGDRAFSGCTLLSNPGDMSGVTRLEGTTFENCTSLTTLNFSNKLTYMDGAFGGCSNLTSPGDMSNVTNIGAVAFRSTKISSINLPSVITISWNSFSDNSYLQKINIGSSCTSIGIQCFSNCTGLIYVVVNSTSPPSINVNSLQNTNNCKIYVPDDSVAAYKVATGWSTYASRIFSLTQFAIDFPNG